MKLDGKKKPVDLTVTLTQDTDYSQTASLELFLPHAINATAAISMGARKATGERLCEGLSSSTS